MSIVTFGLELEEAVRSGRLSHSLAEVIRLQDLDLRLDALSGPAPSEPRTGAEAGDASNVRRAREELAAGIGPALLGRYQELRRRYRRAIVALREGVCQGCFVRVPAAWGGASGTVRSCERCGRILVPWRGGERPAGEPAGSSSAGSASKARAARRGARAARGSLPSTA